MPPCPAPDTCTLLLVRHGATANNVAQPARLQGCGSNLPLSAEGRIQSERTASYLTKYPVGAVYSSPLLRARQTAQAIADRQGLSVEVVAELTEVDVGDWEGRTWEEIAASEPDAYRAFIENPADCPYRGGETFREIRQRVAPVLERLMADNLGRRIVAVAHNGVNRAYLAPLLGLSLRQAREVRQDNGGVSVIRFLHGKAHLVTLNAALHLGHA